MGRASSAKKLRRAAGYNQHRLKMLRELVELANATGGMIKLVIGSDGEHTHWGVWTPTEDAAPACGTLVASFVPANEVDEPDCPACVAMPEEVMRAIRLRIHDDNATMTARAERLLEAMRA